MESSGLRVVRLLSTNENAQVYGWCGLGDAWCTCGPCAEAFGRCVVPDKIELGEHICTKPAHVVTGASQMWENPPGFESKMSAMHDSMPQSSWEQIYKSFKCLKV